jgi:hypothetical protein
MVLLRRRGGVAVNKENSGFSIKQRGCGGI